MTDPLIQVLQRRAERAEVAPDIDAILAGVAHAAAQRGRQRRTAHRAVAASVAVAAVTVGALLLVDDVRSGGEHRAAPPAASSRAAATSQAPASSGAAESSSPASSSPASSSPVPATSRTAPGPGLDHVAAAPRSAPLSVSLVPHGWSYLAAAPDATTYGPSGAHRDAGDFRGKLALIVGQRLESTTPDQLRVAGYPARILTDSTLPGGWIVDIDYSATIELTIQIPGAARLSRNEAMRLAESLDVRDVRHPAMG